MSVHVLGLQDSADSSLLDDGGCFDVYDDVPVMGTGKEEGEEWKGTEHQGGEAPNGAGMSSSASPGSRAHSAEYADQSADQSTDVKTSPRASDAPERGADGREKSSREAAEEGIAPQTPLADQKMVQGIRISWLGSKPRRSPSKRTPVAGGSNAIGEELGSSSGEEAGDDGEPDEVEALTQLLLDPRKTRHAVTSGKCDLPSPIPTAQVTQLV